jgi:hypothetical protein
MDYSFPKSKPGEGTQAISGVVMPAVARQTFRALLLVNTRHWSMKWSANLQ